MASGWTLEDLDEATLAAELSNMAGLNNELVNTPTTAYNMSDVLSLDMFKSDAVYQAAMDLSSPSSGLQFILCAATSPAQRAGEETLTNINRGQGYELKMKGTGNRQQLEGQVVKTVLKICFHERRYQSSEREQWDIWRHDHPGERALDVDYASCFNVTNMECDPMVTSAAVITWEPIRDASVFFKVGCLSTEFAARKHGGEKGVPFRLQVDTFNACDDHIHSAGCQVKVFKDKGADRKNKMDVLRLEKRSQHDASQFQPSFDFTVLTEQPLDSCTASQSSNILAVVKTEPGSYDSYSSSSSAISTPQPQLRGGPSLSSLTTPEFYHKLNLAAFENARLLPESTREEVRSWLEANHFGPFLAVLGNFTGADILRLTRDEMIQILGPAEGIRLDNALQLRAMRPRCVIYVSVEGDQVYQAVYLESLSLIELLRKFAEKLNIVSEQISALHRIVGPSGIPVAVDNEMVQTFVSDMTFQLQVIRDESSNTCRLVMK
ncbi:transcription factor CP2-like [Corticium candelabrum]|uniref:transcription factor CP2-like n=1 Tax=Corticium candelabrum TaxID=121492 RepID=UPI002E26EF9A|nr:transcription factor CP2-like [Corticium candelabrum]